MLVLFLTSTNFLASSRSLVVDRSSFSPFLVFFPHSYTQISFLVGLLVKKHKLFQMKSFGSRMYSKTGAGILSGGFDSFFFLFELSACNSEETIALLASLGRVLPGVSSVFNTRAAPAARRALVVSLARAVFHSHLSAPGQGVCTGLRPLLPGCQHCLPVFPHVVILQVNNIGRHR